MFCTHNKLSYVAFPQAHTINPKKPRLLFTLETTVIGGGETYVLELYKNLTERGYHIDFLVLTNSPFQNKLAKLNIEHFHCAALKYKRWGIPYYPGKAHMRTLCKERKIDIVHCNTERELRIAKQSIRSLPTRIVFTRHLPNKMRPASLANVDGVIGVSPAITQSLSKLNTAKNLHVGTIRNITPLVNEKKFLNFTPTTDRHSFFKTNFDVRLSDAPVLCTVANFYSDRKHKNHHLLFEAVAHLIHTKKYPIEAVLAGDGVGRAALEKYAHELQIDRYVHFLGHTNQIPEIMYHTDFNVLPSSYEALGLVLIEAALLRKPSIGATGTGVTTVITHNQTGLLFENNNAISLSVQIETSVKNISLRELLGKQAHDFVIENFSSAHCGDAHEALYWNVFNDSTTRST